MKPFILSAVFLFALPAFAQTTDYKSVNHDLRAQFKIAALDTAFEGTTSSGVHCEVFVKDKLYQTAGPVDELVIVGQFHDETEYQQLGFQMGPATSLIGANREDSKLTLTASNNSWMTNSTETMTLNGTSSGPFPNVTLSHQMSGGAPDYQNTCGDLKLKGSKNSD